MSHSHLQSDFSDVGMRIRRERTLWNMTQDELSQLLGISANYLGQIERGSRGVSRKMEDRLCEMFHMTHDELRTHKRLDPCWASGVSETGVIFHDLSKEDLIRLLHSCSEEELQFCGHLLRCTLYYLRNAGLPMPLITHLSSPDNPGAAENGQTTDPGFTGFSGLPEILNGISPEGSTASGHPEKE